MIKHNLILPKLHHLHPPIHHRLRRHTHILKPLRHEELQILKVRIDLHEVFYFSEVSLGLQDSVHDFFESELVLQGVEERNVRVDHTTFVLTLDKQSILLLNPDLLRKPHALFIPHLLHFHLSSS